MSLYSTLICTLYVYNVHVYLESGTYTGAYWRMGTHPEHYYYGTRINEMETCGYNMVACGMVIWDFVDVAARCYLFTVFCMAHIYMYTKNVHVHVYKVQMKRIAH